MTRLRLNSDFGVYMVRGQQMVQSDLYVVTTDMEAFVPLGYQDLYGDV